MVRRDLEKERQVELAAIWGSETDGDLRYPKRRRSAARQSAATAPADADGADDALSSFGSDAISEGGGSDRGAPKKKREKKGKKASSAYRLHCFIAPGTERNAVRTVFDAYEPKVELRVSQKGNLLNKTHYAVLTFRNKAMALHSVKMLDGTDQRDLLGVKELKLGLMLSRKEQNASRRSMRKRLREERERRMAEETEADVGFIKRFMSLYAPTGESAAPMAIEDPVAQVYEYLKHVVPASGMNTAVPATTVRKYVGALDESRMFHGEGVLYSAMGFCYKGDFVHGSMAGQGQIMWNNGIQYQGDFRSNAPNGNGIFTWPNGNKYIGEVKHGVCHGNGRMLTDLGVYTGGWVFGKRQGMGHQTYAGDSFYEGEWADDKRHGKGKLVYPNGDVYDGMWENGRRCGFGVMGWKRGTRHYVEVYEGQWSDDIPHGRGRSTYVLYLDADNTPRDVDTPANFAPPVLSVVNVYEGEYVQGVRHGFGAFYYADGGTYEGEWQRGNKEGRGKCTTSVGASYYGVFQGNEAEELLKDSESPSTLPTVAVANFFGFADNSLEEAKSSIHLLLLRFNNTLKTLFDTYGGKFEGIKLITTNPNWWRHRLPGHICIPQYLRMLNDAHVINGCVTIYDVMNCVLLTVEKELEADREAPCNWWTERTRALHQSISEFEGWLNYRQFAESLVRLSVIACVGSNAAELAKRFAALMERSLTKAQLTDEPLCPLTRRHEAMLLPLLPSLKALFLRMGAEPKPQPRGTVDVLPVRDFIALFRDMFDEHDISLLEALNSLFPFDRFKTPGVVPSAICPPRNALGFSMYEKSCGPQGELAAVLVASERRLTFVEFVEAVLGALRLVGVMDDKDMLEKLHEIVATKCPSSAVLM